MWGLGKMYTQPVKIIAVDVQSPIKRKNILTSYKYQNVMITQFLGIILLLFIIYFTARNAH